MTEVVGLATRWSMRAGILSGIDPPADSGALLLTPSAVTAVNYYHDSLPAGDTAGTYVYTVMAVDSSYNFSVGAEYSVERPSYLKKNFPIYFGGTPKQPVVADYDKDGLAEIYAIRQNLAWVHHGKVYGVRADGQEAVVEGANDGFVFGRRVDYTAPADLNGDGFDDLVFVAGDTVGAYDLKNRTFLFRDTLEGYTADMRWFAEPMVADMDGNGDLEAVCYGGMDAGYTVLEIVDKNG